MYRKESHLFEIEQYSSPSEDKGKKAFSSHIHRQIAWSIATIWWLQTCDLMQAGGKNDDTLVSGREKGGKVGCLPYLRASKKVELGIFDLLQMGVIHIFVWQFHLMHPSYLISKVAHYN